MIPKIIHYCWFGRGQKPALAEMCIASWRKYLPDYQIIEWNEDNFDVSANDYIREAYEAKKYAFVSDFARFEILYKFGGLYFDTDVEVIAPLTHIIQAGPFMGCEVPASPGQDPMKLSVAAGLGLGAVPGMDLYKQVIDHYNSIHYLVDGKAVARPLSVVEHVTAILCRNGLQNVNEVQQVAGINIYPHDYFCPVSVVDFALRITDRTVSIHHYAASWRPKSHQRKRKLQRALGPRITNFIIKIKDFILNRK